MKTLFVHAKSDLDVVLSDESLKQLPKQRYGVATTIQHLHRIKDVLAQLPDSILVGQVLGCRADNVKKIVNDVDAFLYIGMGEFHPIRVALEADGKDVYVYNPLSKQLTKIDCLKIDKYKSRVKARLNTFYHAKTVGLLVSTKPCQNNGMISTCSLDEKMRLPKDFLERRDKKYYLFAFDTLDHQALDDFPFIDCWINFACNRIMDDKNPKIVNVQDVLDADDEAA